MSGRRYFLGLGQSRRWWLPPDRKGVVLSRLLMVGLDHGPNKMLKTGPTVVQALADEDTKVGRERLNVCDLGRVPSGLDIRLYPDSERLSALKPLQFAIQGVQTFVCPVKLGDHRHKWIYRHALNLPADK
jgi:hypothetical protein